MKPHLILDESSVADASGVGFRLNPAQKHGGNPVLSPGRPYDWDGLQIEWPGTVLYDPVDDLYKCWYSGFEGLQHPGRKWRFGYAESPDGVTWSKPRLGQVEYRGEPTNQIAEPPGTFAMSTVFLDPAAGPGEPRYLGLWVRTGGETWTHRKVIARSHDGIEWETGDPIWDGFYDVSQVLFDPDDPDPQKRVKMYAQAHYRPEDLANGPTRPSWPGGADVRRSIAYLTGPDIVSMVEPERPLALAPEPGLDDELHFAGVQKVGDTYLMLFESDRFATDPIHGDLRLAASDDGLTFRRVHPHAAVVPTGPHGSWDDGLLVTTTAGLFEVGHEVRIYYFGSSSVYRCWPASYADEPGRRGSMVYPTHLGVAVLPRDRYGYAHGPGTLVTEPFAVGDQGVWVNVDGEANGFSLHRPGQDGAVAEGHVGRERWQGQYRRVVFPDGAPQPGTYRLRVDLAADGRLYSYAG